MKNSVIQLGKCVALHMTVVAVKMQRIRPMPHLTFGIAGQAAKTNPKKVHINIIISVSVSIYNHFFSFQAYKFLLNPLILSLECMGFCLGQPTQLAARRLYFLFVSPTPRLVYTSANLRKSCHAKVTSRVIYFPLWYSMRYCWLIKILALHSNTSSYI